ncbi:MAG: hypothetical protein FWE27_07485 [Defluviitaleaceae bacterium]|nr:hypothetical protein [Defluviitaleaceae bacterium]
MPPDPNFDKNTNEKKGKGSTIAIVIILILVFAVVAVLVLDIGNVRSQHVMGFLRDAPLIGSLFPAPEEPDPLDEMTEEEMRLALHVYRDQVEGLQTRLRENDAEIARLNARIEHLSRFEASWQQYRIASANFIDILSRNAPLDFVEFFKDIVNYDLVPQDILGMAYARAEAINISDEELNNLVRTHGAMEADRVAEDLERLLTANQSLAVRLARAMGNSRRGEVFNEMESAISSRFTILLSTEPPVFGPLVAPQYLPEINSSDIPVPTPAPVEIDDEEDETEDDDEEESEPEEE